MRRSPGGRNRPWLAQWLIHRFCGIRKQEKKRMNRLMIFALLLSPVYEASANVMLDTCSLPSTQGWTYLSSGEAEGSIFSIINGGPTGCYLHQDSMATVNGPGGTAYQYYELQNVFGPALDS